MFYDFQFNFKPNKRRNKMLEIFQNYALHTNLHGFIYIAKSFQHRIERIFWSLVIFTSMVLTGIMINKLLLESQKNPIVIYTDQNVVPVQDLNFPAISVCPGIVYQTPHHVAFDYDLAHALILNNTFNIDALTNHELKMLQVTSLINRDGFVRTYFKRFAINTDDFMDKLHSFELPWFSAFSEFRNETVSFFDATWLKNFYASFTQTLWKGGFCYTFNFPKPDEMFHIKKISKYFNYTVYTPGEELRKFSKFNSTPPFKSPLPGNGLIIRYNELMFSEVKKKIHILDHRRELEYSYNYFNILKSTIPSTPFGGHRLIFHDSYEIIPCYAKIFHSSPDTTTKILVTPSIKRIDNSLMTKTPEE
jgi:hypothetical protein